MVHNIYIKVYYLMVIFFCSVEVEWSTAISTQPFYHFGFWDAGQSGGGSHEE